MDGCQPAVNRRLPAVEGRYPAGTGVSSQLIVRARYAGCCIGPANCCTVIVERSTSAPPRCFSPYIGAGGDAVGCSVYPAQPCRHPMRPFSLPARRCALMNALPVLLADRLTRITALPEPFADVIAPLSTPLAQFSDWCAPLFIPVARYISGRARMHRSKKRRVWRVIPRIAGFLGSSRREVPPGCIDMNRGVPTRTIIGGCKPFA